MTSAAFTLPSPVQRRIDRAADDLLNPEGMPRVDFTTPAGEEALVPADSVSWRIFKNPVTLFVSGVSAVLLELAEPGVRDGVWQHSGFRTDALTRLQRTGMAAMVTVYGAKSQAEAMIAGVVRAHDRVRGTTSEGRPYHANDPVLLDWVQATASFGFIGAYDRYAGALSPAERDRALAEGKPAARLYGATGAPGSEAEMREIFARMDDRLVPSPIIAEFLEIMRKVDAFPLAMRPLQSVLLRAAVDMLPDHLIARLKLGRWRLRTGENPLVKAAAKASDHIVLRSAPPALASQRLGLPAEHCYQLG